MNDPFIYSDSTGATLFAKIVYRELGNEAFWKFHDQLYSEQPVDSKYEKIDLYSTSFLEKTLNKVVSQTDIFKTANSYLTQHNVSLKTMSLDNYKIYMISIIQ